ncbi:pilus assembly protein TadG-related protein [Cryobacterium sp. SO2]|uniref:pilus assembly protein TadG-related protein n=1 Tax=Cryobacterium sp. SO2 TaxID=1897060 RepID=UPI00223DA7FC|nr:pilus assembly protein TadG-related protein [Cryobacterium sp. SO2]WEO78454.1 pilus assembly protein TadG-related protein [Cryobacterium sp. SO2]
MRRLRRRVQGEEGSTLLLTIFYGFLALVVVLIVVAATSLYLERKKLFTLADGAALAGAESFALDAVAIDSGELHAALTTPEIRAAATAYLAAAPHPELESVTLTRAETVDGQSATVSLRAWWRPPVLTLFVPDGLPVEVTAVARSVFH